MQILPKFLVMDNGADIIKIGIKNDKVKAKLESRRTPFIAEQIEKIVDKSALFYQKAFQKGYLINWNIEKQVWERVFNHILPNQKFDEVNLIITVPHMNFPFITDSLSEIMFEDYGINSILQITSSALAAYKFLFSSNSINQCIVIDSGYSFTHISHFHRQGQKIYKDKDKLRCLDIGGKFLTNYLKDILSYRQLQVMEETYVINQLKETACFVSQTFESDMQTCTLYGLRKENPLFCEYVLPDFQKVHRGFIKSHEKESSNVASLQNIDANTIDHKPIDNETTTENNLDIEDLQTLKLTNERITVPELLFHPSDIGLRQMGIAELCIDSLTTTNENNETTQLSETNAKYLSAILLIGGNTKFPGFVKRLVTELKALTPKNTEINCYLPDDPVMFPVEAGMFFAENVDKSFYNDLVLTHQQYKQDKDKTLATQKFVL